MAAIFFPIYWVITISTKEMVDMFTTTPKFIYKPIIRHYKELFLGGGVKRIAAGTFLNSILKSIKVSLGSVFFAAIIGIPAAYSIAKFRFKGRNGFSMWILTILMLPPVVAIIPVGFLLLFLQFLRKAYDYHKSWGKSKSQEQELQTTS